MEFDATGIFEAVLALIAALITGFLIPFIKSRTSEAQQETLMNWVAAAVAAAEQLYESGEGEAKKQYVLDWLADCGIDVSGIDIDAIIEAAVYEINQN